MYDRGFGGRIYGTPYFGRYGHFSFYRLINIFYDINLWESYQQLPSLTRITITFSITLFLTGFIYWCNRLIKKRTIATRAVDYNSNLITQKSNGVFYIYIAYWRFIVIAFFLVPMLYILLTGFLNLYQGLPKYFWRHWSTEATLTLIVLITIPLIITVMVQLLIKGYKAVQLEIGKDYVRFRKGSVKGGILLSNEYINLKYSEIAQIDFRKAPLIDYVLTIKTAGKTYNTPLLLSPEDKVVSYRILDQAVCNWQKSERKNIKTN